MKTILTICAAFILFSITACDKGEMQSREKDKARLDKMRQEILDRIAEVPCNDPKEWDFTALGSKACGGPQEYIAYPLTIDTDELLSLVENYTEAEKAYNRKYGIVSDCMAVMPPSDVRCEDGKPKLVFSDLNP